MKQNILETAIGILVIAAAAIFFLNSYSSQRKEVREVYHLTATFQNVDGIIKGSDVSIAGINVGTVESLELNKQTYDAVMKIAIDKSIKVPTDSRAIIATSGIIGGKYLDISPGGDDTYLNEGDKIKYTQSSLNLESLISKFMTSTSSGSSSPVAAPINSATATIPESSATK